ncbi:dockerin type I domain-containing protein [Ruminococcus flavefaciens]|uniref:dockerin type I domain-containing protein n=1 Tax=Ruminococcus flavefaciens TaxID=1265 RepID=UPI0004661FCB|nr:dockerin type I domain-containing protein [Ruminococcus flavefaciens]
MLKRIAAAFLSAGALLGSALCVNAAGIYTNGKVKFALDLGDADNNGAVNAVDASIILSNYARYSTSTDKPSDYELITQDVNDDGLVNAVDASIVLSYYAYRSIGGYFNLSEYIKNPNEAPTESVTATTTAAAATTTTTTQTTTEPTTYEYTLENITQSAEVFNYFAKELNDCVFRGRGVSTTGWNGEDIYLNGEKGSKVAILLLNENLNYKDGVLSEIFAGYNDADIRDGIQYFYDISLVEKVCNSDVDFNEFTFNRDIGDFMNMLENAKKNGDATGDYSELNNIMEDILFNGQYDFAANNVASLYYTLGVGRYCSGSNYKGDCGAFASEGDFDGIQVETENRIKSLIK